ncbi:MAG: hypothetical protein LBT59_18370 [Clostridiales bacterium]|nr:hypothetical protein [Clostridiales bacterium]
MATIVKKIIKGHIYFYYVETKRISGKPKCIVQKYLGTAETIYRKLQYYDLHYNNSSKTSDYEEQPEKDN